MDRRIEMKFGGNMGNGIIYRWHLKFLRLENKSVWFGKKGENQLFECPDFRVGDTKKFMKHKIINKQRETFFVKEWFFSEKSLSKFLEDDELKSVF